MASRQVTRLYDRELAPAGVTANAYSILARLESEGPMPLGTLAARLAMDRTTLSREAASLVDAKLIASAHGETDRRKRVLSLTDRGLQTVATGRPLHARAQSQLMDTFGLERATELIEELRVLLGADE